MARLTRATTKAATFAQAVLGTGRVPQPDIVGIPTEEE